MHLLKNGNTLPIQMEHGFNTGALAAFSYVLDIIESGVKFAEDQFPNLDT